KLGDILLNLEYVSNEQLAEALKIQEENRLGNILIRKKYITKEQLREVLDRQDTEIYKFGL
ncbi:type II secretion system protein GspE, partial [bacterium]|nr:type II secretion system protein GspE [bacterium]